MSDFLKGIGAFTIVLVLIFVTILTLYGLDDFEMGFWFSLMVSWLLILIAFLMGVGILSGLSWLLRKVEMSINPSLVVFGSSLVVLIWSSTEIPATARTVKKYLSESEAVLLSIALASLISLVPGWVGLKSK